jgi:hypothetical protein
MLMDVMCLGTHGYVLMGVLEPVRLGSCTCEDLGIGGPKMVQWAQIWCCTG